MGYNKICLINNLFDNIMHPLYSYMAPEVMMSRTRPSPCTDVFSFGRLVFFVMTGQTPLRHLKTRTDFKNSYEVGEVPELSWPEVPVCLQQKARDLCKRCLAFQPSQRPQDAGVIFAELQSWSIEFSASSDLVADSTDSTQLPEHFAMLSADNALAAAVKHVLGLQAVARD